MMSGDLTRPFMLAWELRQACKLACIHPRADAQLRRHSLKLATSETFSGIDDIARFDFTPMLTLTGGDPRRQPGVIDLIPYGTTLEEANA